ncbi:MAG: hypothetical protein ABIO17_09655, partial [Pseudoxanthomonas sp.]
QQVRGRREMGRHLAAIVTEAPLPRKALGATRGTVNGSSSAHGERSQEVGSGHVVAAYSGY